MNTTNLKVFFIYICLYIDNILMTSYEVISSDITSCFKNNLTGTFCQ